ncbi:MAG: hypothetical protein E6J91_24080 [Deltaproteobacteria bacterium]|nr:MAG: hypothetical protein E6J91_24080 [Deltaproteobacteria bacterium]
MRIVDLNKLALDLVAMDFSNGHAPSNGGPTKTSRALAIIHLAARDAYARVTSAYAPKLQGLAAPHAGIGPGDADGQAAAVGAGIRAVTVLYPDFGAFIAAQSPALTAGLNPAAVMYGGEVANAWLASRHDDGSSQPQLDSLFSAEPGHHRPDPVSNRPSLGRAWGRVTPFVISSVTADEPLGPPPALTTKAYADAYDDVFVNGRNNIAERTPEFRDHAAIGIFWGYDGSSRLGTPPRLYNQIVVSTTEFAALAAKDQLNVLAAINAAMADAGIAAWHWKYVYDLCWARPPAIRSPGPWPALPERTSRRTSRPIRRVMRPSAPLASRPSPGCSRSGPAISSPRSCPMSSTAPRWTTTASSGRAGSRSSRWNRASR